MIGVYLILCRSNGKRYIGSSVQIEARWREHKRLLRQAKHPNPKLQAAWNKYGADQFHFEVLEEVAHVKLMAAEQAWLETAKPEFNINPNADAPCRGAPAAIVAKISKALTGKKASAETRAKMSAARIGRKQSEDCKRLLSEIRRGIAQRPAGFKHSEATREKMKQSWVRRREARLVSP